MQIMVESSEFFTPIIPVYCICIGSEPSEFNHDSRSNTSNRMLHSE